LRAGRVVALGAPGELYRRPTSRFVAEFLGETNFIPATAAGASLSTPIGALRSSHPPPAPEIVISIRPEALKIGDGAGANSVRGRVLESPYLGELAQYLVELPGPTRLRAATLNPGAPVPPGTEVCLQVDPDDVVLLPAG